MKLRLPARKKGRIEMIPLIDCIFLLLVFFIYGMLSMSVHRGVKVELPKTVTGAIEPHAPILLTLRAGGRIELNEREVGIEEVAKETSELARARPDSPVLISGEKGADLALALDVLDRLRLAGVPRVTFLTDEKKAGQ